MAVVSHHTMSLDGFVAGPDDTMDWVSGHGRATDLAERTRSRIDAIVAGRRWHDLALDRGNGVDGIYGGAFEGPVFVVSHRPPPGDVDPRVTFVTGLDDALAAAGRAAGEGDVAVFGGSLTRQCAAKGVLDEVVVHLVPVLLGGGVRLYGEDGDPTVRLERVECAPAEQITDLRFRVVC
ncbi:MAG: dihydrofolate reductase family protein [Nocardioides sp.]|nr:dihydrofolate reductase family protein [Nocardioides sp.]